MASKTSRYPIKIIQESKEDILGKKANIVLKDGSVLFAVISSISSDFMTVVNLRNKKQQVNLTDLTEVIIDSKV
ncbi:hypothetical protein [Fulvivirga lutea]|uniref:Uncharacterized protein n=1 Tax=Fulvivirga lutea TaxID=2810512 RepID=A0A974WMF3_9BACT|nr:hypothetical protein [Fulvivirga lutea]QSE98945.1 hypothetical protein JR347_07640 [Fulvivirga lutea]